MQRVAPTPAAVLPWLPVVHLAALPADARRREAERLAAAEARRPFSLAQGPLLRAVLLRLGEQEHRLLLTAHHAVADAWSIGVFLRELEALYGAFARGVASPLPEPPLQFADYAAWQRERVASGALAGAFEHWRRQLSGLSPLALPFDRPRSAVQTSRGAVVNLTLGRELTAALQALGRREGATPFMVLLAAFQELLARYTGGREVAVGAPWADRGRAEIAGLVGFFVNTLVLRAEIPAEQAFRELLGRTRERVLAAHAHCELPLEAVAGELVPGRGLGDALFQTVLAFEDMALGVDLPGLTAEVSTTGTGTAKFDLTLMVRPGAGGLVAVAEHSADLFDCATVERLLRSLATLLAGAVADPGCRASELPLLGAAERQHLLIEWNRTAAAPTLAGCVHRLFERQAALAPGGLAVAATEGDLTYGELNRRANHLAHRLSALGVGPERPVVVLMKRSLSQVTAVLAVLKAGGAYLPLDPAYPTDLLELMVRDSGAGVVLVRTADDVSLAPPPAGVALLAVDELDWSGPAGDANPEGGAQSRNLAYLIYTSGSTGTPKAVAVEHASLLNLVDWHRNVYRITREDRAALVAGPAFDASVWDTWAYLTAGASLHLVDDETAVSATRLLDWLSRRRITLGFLPTPLAEVMLPTFPAVGLALRALFTGGDRLHRRPESPLSFQLVNHYGPTEGTVVSTCAPVVDGDAGMPPIGRPISNIVAYVLDARLQPLPIGVPGELCVGGLGLSRGYLGNPDRTAERFVPDPFGPPGARLYRTGDLARHRSDGDLEFLGRTDHQIKIRGFRIELGEVEAAILRHPDIGEAAVAVRENGVGDRRLVCGFVPLSGRPVEPAELADYLGRHLPPAMVPTVLTRLEALPLTANGKVDRTALPDLAGGAAGGTDFVAPRGDVEEILADLWRDVLGVSRIGVYDNFFELGGHSIKVTQLLFRIQDLFEVEIPPHRFLAAPTIASLAVTLAEELAGAVDEDVLSGLLGEMEESGANSSYQSSLVKTY